MVLKWRPDGDRGLIAAEGGGGAPVSPPTPAVQLLWLKLHLSICSPPIIKPPLLFHHSLLCPALLTAIIVRLLCSPARLISAVVSSPLFPASSPLCLPPH